MATLREYYEKDSMHGMRVHRENTLTDERDSSTVKVEVSVTLNFWTYSKYVSLFIHECSTPEDVITHYLRDVQSVLREADDIRVSTGWVGLDEWVGSTELKFTGRVYIYTLNPIEQTIKQQLIELAKTYDLSLVIRGKEYADARSKIEKPFAFLCHDSKDKEAFVSELALRLQKMMCPVWYDEYSLEVGDSLRESIEKGIKECKKCILVLSPNFFSNEGWTKAEFDSIYMKEIVEQNRIMLPVWHNVTAEDVYEYSPRLADRLGIPTSLGVEEVARRLYRAILKESES